MFLFVSASAGAACIPALDGGRVVAPALHVALVFAWSRISSVIERLSAGP